jgi:hypothetical protein
VGDADQVFADTLDRALRLGQSCHHAYLAASPCVRRLMNQEFFTSRSTSATTTPSAATSPSPFATLLGTELTQQAEAALAAEPENPPPHTGRRVLPAPQPPRVGRV